MGAFLGIYGYVQWILQPSDPANPRHHTYFPYGYEPEGSIIGENLATRVVRADRVQDESSRTANIFLELAEACAGISVKHAQGFTVAAVGDYQRILGTTGTMSFTITLTYLDIVKIYFFLPKLRNVWVLPQQRKRRQSLVLFGVKKTRSNKKNFRSLRVDSPTIGGGTG